MVPGSIVTLEPLLKPKGIARIIGHNNTPAVIKPGFPPPHLPLDAVSFTFCPSTAVVYSTETSNAPRLPHAPAPLEFKTSSGRGKNGKQ